MIRKYLPIVMLMIALSTMTSNCTGTSDSATTYNEDPNKTVLLECICSSGGA